jgi:hypothetical protein
MRGPESEKAEINHKQTRRARAFRSVHLPSALLARPRFFKA